MDFVIDKETLLAALRRVQRTAATKNPMAILGFARLTVKSNILTMATTDLEMSTVVELALMPGVTVAGSTAVDAKQLGDLVASLAGSSVGIETTEGWMQVTCGKGKFKLPTLPPGDMPAMPDDSAAIYATIDAPGLLVAAVDDVAYAAYTGEDKPMCSTVSMTSDGALLTLVSLDGHRMAMASASLPMPITVPKGVLVRPAAMATISAAIDGAQSCEIAITSTHIFAKVAGTRVAAKLVALDYPPWRDVVPKSHSCHIELDRLEFLGALKRCSLLGREDGGVIIDVRDGSIGMRSESAKGNAVESLDAKVDGTAVTVTASAKYMRESAARMGGAEFIRIGLTGPLDPMTVGPVSGLTRMAVVMPMKD